MFVVYADEFSRQAVVGSGARGREHAASASTATRASVGRRSERDGIRHVDLADAAAAGTQSPDTPPRVEVSRGPEHSDLAIQRVVRQTGPPARLTSTNLGTIETCFQEGKLLLVLGDYESCSWQCWHGLLLQLLAYPVEWRT